MPGSVRLDSKWARFTLSPGDTAQPQCAFLRPSIQRAGELFSWDVKRKRVSGLWESSKTAKSLTGQSEACFKKAEKKGSWEVRNDKGRWKETRWCDVITLLQELGQEEAAAARWRETVVKHTPKSLSGQISGKICSERILNRCCASFAGC